MQTLLSMPIELFVTLAALKLVVGVAVIMYLTKVR